MTRRSTFSVSCRRLLKQRRLLFSVGIVFVVTLAAASVFVGIASAAETATITDTSPVECTALDPGQEHTITVTVDYDLDGQNPDRITLTLSEDGYGEVDNTVDLSGEPSSGTVTVSVTDFVDSSWDTARVGIDVFAEGASTTTANDIAYFEVDGSGGTCETDPETLSGIVEPGVGDDPPPGIVLVERLSDGETSYQEYRTDSNCPGCFEFTENAFIEPGDYRIHVYGSDSGYPPYWGYLDTTIVDGESQFEEVNRGGVYTTNLHVTDSNDESGLRYGLEETIPTTLDVQRPRHGTEVKVEIYIHESGTTRGDNPDDVYTHGSLSGDTASLDFEVAAPAVEGTYEIDYLILTYFDVKANYLITDIVEGPEFTVDQYDPPRIESATPSDSAVSVSQGDSITFEVTATDPDSQSSELTQSWSVDETKVTTGGPFTFDASDWSQGEHTVTVRVADESNRTENATQSWTVNVVESRPPELTDWSPQGTAIDVQSGDQVAFEVSATDPEGSTLEYEWYLDGSYKNSGTLFSNQFIQPGSHNVTVVVTDSQDVKSSRTWLVDVSNFKEQPLIDPQVTATTLAPEQKREFVTVSVQHPSVNERNVRVELVIRPPDGITVSTTSNTVEGDPAQFVGYETIEPGEQTSIAISLNVNDESLVGDTLEIEYRVLYFPEGERDSFRPPEFKKVNVTVAPPSTPDAGDVPGFGMGAAVLALLMASISGAIKRHRRA